MERFRKKLAGWKSLLLSRGGRREADVIEKLSMELADLFHVAFYHSSEHSS